MQNKHRIFTLCLIGIHTLFFVTKIIIGDFFIIDSHEYYQLAENILHEFQFYCGDLNADIDFRNYTRRPPLYAVFIIISSGFLKSAIGTLLFQNIISIISLLLIKKIFEENFYKINYTLLFIFIGTSINQFVYSNMIMSEVFFQFLIVLLFYNLHKVIKLHSWKYLIFFQINIILLFLTKPVFYLFIIPNIILTILIYRKTKIKYGFLSSILPLLIFLLYSNWNLNRTGSYDFSSMQNFNLLEWNLKYFHQNKYGYEKSKGINDQILSEAAKINNYNDSQSYIKKQIFTYLKKDPVGYGIFHLKGCLRIVVDPGRFDLVNFFKIKDDNNEGILHHINEQGITGVIKFLRTQPTIILLSLFIILTFNFLKIIGFIWFWIKNYKSSNLLILSFLFVILYIIALTGPLGASRFFVPVLPAYLMFSALGFTDLMGKLKHIRFYKKDKILLN